MFRNPDPLFRPEFWAEDGEIFFYDPFYFGAVSVFYPVFSSFHLLARVIALLAAFAPALYIPAIYAWVSFLIYICVFLYFLRDSFSYLIPSLLIRIIFVLLMATTLGSWEVQMNLANLLYLLGAFMALLSLEKPIRSSAFYLCLWSILSFSSPLFYVFLPFHFLMWFFTKNISYLKITCVLFVTFLISMINVIFHCWDHTSPVYIQGSVTTFDFSYVPQLWKIMVYQFLYGIHFVVPLGEKLFVEIVLFGWTFVLWSLAIAIIFMLIYCIRKKIFLELLFLSFCVSLIFSIQCITRHSNASEFFFPGTLMTYIDWNYRYSFIGGVLGIILCLSIAYRCFTSNKIIVGTMLSVLLFYNVIFYTNHNLPTRSDKHWPLYASQLDRARDDLRHGITNADNHLPDMLIHGDLEKVKLSLRYPF